MSNPTRKMVRARGVKKRAKPKGSPWFHCRPLENSLGQVSWALWYHLRKGWRERTPAAPAVYAYVEKIKLLKRLRNGTATAEEKLIAAMMALQSGGFSAAKPV